MRSSAPTATEPTPTPDRPPRSFRRGGERSAPVSERPQPSLRQRALAALARRDHSRAELARKLGRHADDPSAVDALLDEFEANGWLSDERFAGTAARQRQGRFSQRYIVEDLKQKGVAGPTARDAVDALAQDDYATALALWRQRFGAPPADQKEKARQVRFLQARGFSLGVVFRVLREAGAVEEAEPDV